MTRRLSRRQALLAPLALTWRSPSTAHAAGARAQRLVAPEGVVRVWKPSRYDPATAGLLIYVHGLYTDVDRAWSEHDLPAQFARSGRNALFIVPAARSEATAPTPWGPLQTLIDRVARDVPDVPTAGPLVVAGHSGAYKQIILWLDHPRLHTLLLLDALYGGQPELRAWLDAAPENRISLISHDTIPAARDFIAELPAAVYRRRCPDHFPSLTEAERAAKVLSMDTRTDHFGIITEGHMLPLLLRWSSLPAR
ncbi:MAG TPA: hypothetical protein VH374_00700 [Polyangia bacterium]|nr:hypothetical protein [Polyangia bacterium]